MRQGLWRLVVALRALSGPLLRAGCRWPVARSCEGRYAETGTVPGPYSARAAPRCAAVEERLPRAAVQWCGGVGKATHDAHGKAQGLPLCCERERMTRWIARATLHVLQDECWQLVSGGTVHWGCLCTVRQVPCSRTPEPTSGPLVRYNVEDVVCTGSRAWCHLIALVPPDITSHLFFALVGHRRMRYLPRNVYGWNGDCMSAPMRCEVPRSRAFYGGVEYLITLRRIGHEDSAARICGLVAPVATRHEG